MKLQELPRYDPGNLFDAVIKHLSLKNDAALSRVLGIPPPVISKVRHKVLPVGATMLIRLHEVSEIAIKDLRSLMGDHRKNFAADEHIPNEDKGVAEMPN